MPRRSREAESYTDPATGITYSGPKYKELIKKAQSADPASSQYGFFVDDSLNIQDFSPATEKERIRAQKEAEKAELRAARAAIR